MEILCPDCGTRENYQLADGRRQCRDCRRKFTPGGRKRRLPIETQHKVREAFWRMQPAEEVASRLNVNRKTIQKMYGEFRERIRDFNHRQRLGLMKNQSEDDVTGNSWCELVKAWEIPMFYLVGVEEYIALFFADEFDAYADKVHAWELATLMVYRRDEGGVVLDPEVIYRRQLWGGEREQNCRACLEYMLVNLKAYRGAPADKTMLYAEEMVFRFNYRNRDTVLEAIDSAEGISGETLN